MGRRNKKTPTPPRAGPQTPLPQPLQPHPPSQGRAGALPTFSVGERISFSHCPCRDTKTTPRVDTHFCGLENILRSHINPSPLSKRQAPLHCYTKRGALRSIYRVLTCRATRIMGRSKGVFRTCGSFSKVNPSQPWVACLR